MNSLRKQRGMGMLGMLLIAIMVGFFIMVAIKAIPGYLEYLTVRDIVIRAAEDFDRETDQISDIRLQLATFLNTNQVRNIDYKDIEIARKDGKTIIDASYEERIPLFWRVDMVMKYDDLEFEAGVKHSDDG